MPINTTLGDDGYAVELVSGTGITMKTGPMSTTLGPDGYEVAFPDPPPDDEPITFVSRWEHMITQPPDFSPATVHPAPLEVPLTPGNLALNLIYDPPFRGPFVTTDNGGNEYTNLLSLTHPDHNLQLNVNGAIVATPADVTTLTMQFPNVIRQYVMEFAGFGDALPVVEDQATTSATDVESASVTLTTTAPSSLLIAVTFQQPSVRPQVSTPGDGLYRLDFENTPPTPYTDVVSQHLVWRIVGPGTHTIGSTWAGQGNSSPKTFGLALCAAPA